MKIRYVDGFKIRQTLDPDFGIAHGHSTQSTHFSPKFYIPKREYWIDHLCKAETQFLIAIEKAQYAEADIERNRDEKFVDRQRRYEQKRFCKKGSPPLLVRRTKILPSGTTVMFVDGSLVRQYLDPSFVMGGNAAVYSYVPKNSIWLDALLDPLDLKHVLIHEAIEMGRMRTHRDSYDVAHEFATAEEKRSRRRAGGVYPGDANFPSVWTHESIINSFYV